MWHHINTIKSARAADTLRVIRTKQDKALTAGNCPPGTPPLRALLCSQRLPARTSISSETLWAKLLPAERSQERHKVQSCKVVEQCTQTYPQEVPGPSTAQSRHSSRACAITQGHIQPRLEYLRGRKCHLHGDRFSLPAICVFIACMPQKSLHLSSLPPPIFLDKTDSPLPAAWSVKANRSLPQPRGAKAPAKETADSPPAPTQPAGTQEYPGICLGTRADEAHVLDGVSPLRMGSLPQEPALHLPHRRSAPSCPSAQDNLEGSLSEVLGTRFLALQPIRCRAEMQKWRQCGCPSTARLTSGVNGRVQKHTLWLRDAAACSLLMQ